MYSRYMKYNTWNTPITKDTLNLHEVIYLTHFSYMNDNIPAKTKHK